MKHQTIGEIFDANDKARAKFKEVVSLLTDKQAVHKIAGEKWSIAQIVEHVSVVEEGIARICAKLLARAEEDGTKYDGRFELPREFFSKADEMNRIKVEAPERVHPTEEGRPISESLVIMDENCKRFNQMRPAFDKYDCTKHKFPHPFFGDISAVEWLILVGGHKIRHLKQIKNIIDKM